MDILRSEKMKEIAKSINPNWYSITLIELVVFGTLMLFIKELPEVWKSYLLPSLIVHLIGTGLIGYFQGALFRAKGMVQGYHDPVVKFGIAYAVWFVALIAYFMYRGLL
ncbi:hypothetical protein N9Z14_01765 [Opitutales bacterium]|nr:hypothetical protein [Opitutales bacterium]